MKKISISGLLVLCVFAASCSFAASKAAGKLSVDDALNLISEAMPYEGEGEIQQHESKWEKDVELYRFEIHWYGDSATYYSILVNSVTGAMDREEIEYDYAQAMREHWEGSTGPSEEVTLRDDETGNTETLYPPFSEEDQGLLFYGNNRFGYSVKVPEIFTKVVLLPDNGDGMILQSKDGKASFRVSGGFVIDEGMLKESYDSALKSIGGENKAAYFDIDIEENTWWVTWWKGDTYHTRRFLMNGEDAWADCEISYQSVNGEYNPFDEIAYRALQGLVFAEG